MATLVPCLVRLRTDFDWLFPGRDRASDGWIGDPAHQARDSDHNPDGRGLVHAIDVDNDLSAMADMQAFVDHLVARCQTGAENRLTYIIYRRRIWSASWNWRARRYGGSNPHDKHAHFSASDTPSRERSTASWRLEEVPVALTDADKKWLAADNDRAAKAAVSGLLAVKTGDKAHPTRTVGDVLRDAAKLRGVLVGDKADTTNAKVPPGSPLGRLLSSVAEPEAK
jgi:hypothetical protein